MYGILLSRARHNNTDVLNGVDSVQTSYERVDGIIWSAVNLRVHPTISHFSTPQIDRSITVIKTLHFLFIAVPKSLEN